MAIGAIIDSVSSLVRQEPASPTTGASETKATETSTTFNIKDSVQLDHLEGFEELFGDSQLQSTIQGLVENYAGFKDFNELLASVPKVSHQLQVAGTTGPPQISKGGIVNPYDKEFHDATSLAGVPLEWADNESLKSLVQHESGFRPDAKNPNSTAYGLFQFIDSTWEHYLPEVPYGTNDPTWQAVGGYRYIDQVYGDPDRAWAFWQATAQEDITLAPPDLRDKAQIWIQNGYKGY